MKKRGGNNQNKTLLYIVIGIVIFLCVIIFGGIFYINRIKSMMTGRVFSTRNIAALQLKKIQEDSRNRTDNIDNWLAILEEEERKNELKQSVRLRDSENRVKRELEELIELQISTTQRRISQELDTKISSLKKLLMTRQDEALKQKFSSLANSDKERMLEYENALKKRHDDLVQKNLLIAKEKLAQKFSNFASSDKERILEYENALKKRHEDLVQKNLLIAKEELSKKFNKTLTSLEQKKLEAEEVANKKIAQLDNKIRYEVDSLRKSTSENIKKHLNKKIDKLVKKEKAARSYEFEKQKNEVNQLVANMLDNIEKRFVTTQKDKKEEEKLFAAMMGKLGQIHKTHSSQLVMLEKKLNKIKNMKMAAQTATKEREISQTEVDSIIKQEVRKQLSSLNGQRNSKLKRLKKVVALEKMRRLVKGMVNGEDHENILDF